MVDTLRHDDRHILVRGEPWAAGDHQGFLWKVDTRTGMKTKVAMSPIAGAAFYTDDDGELRFAAGRDDKYDWRFYLREEDRTWKELKRVPGLGPGSELLRYDARAQAIEVVEPDGAGFTVSTVRLATGERTQLARTETAPPTELLRDRATGRLLAVASEPDVPAVELLDDKHPVAKALDGLLAAFPGQRVTILDRTEDDRLAVAWVGGDRQPGQLLLVDVAKGSAEALGSSRPWIVPEEMGETQAFHLSASDGVRIHGYLTLPPGTAPGAPPPPLVVLPHGGPHGVRDIWGFDHEVQLLATQGFAVLQVNYRGSGGYGAAYEQAGYRRWGDRVVQDVIDATRWAVRKGKVDGGRVCAYGASFGAYAAMQAAILAPELIRCAAGLSGIYDLTIMESRGDISWKALGRGYVRRAVGDDDEALKAASPAHQAARLTAPVLLAHGGRDKRAPLAHAERLRDALAAQGRPPVWLVEPAEGHGFFDEAARLRFATRLVAFLKEHTAPKAAAAPAASPAPGVQATRP